ncbi:MAG: DoxX family membrane protein [Pseudomonadota bacterium]
MKPLNLCRLTLCSWAGLGWNTRLTLWCLLSAGLILGYWPSAAEAHVKWFAEYDLACPPRSPSQILFGEYFFLFCLFIGPLMFAVAYIDRRLVSEPNWLAQGVNALTDRTQACFPVFLRLGVSAFFLAAVAYGGFILTPELKTDASWVSGTHLAIAGLALSPSTAFVAGIGMVALYVHAIAEFGLYHLLDYPIFLGVAAYLAIVSFFGQAHATTAHNVMRWATGITLLWAGIEKFAFPEWSFKLLVAKPELTFGFTPEFYMVAAGFVEFCCAFLLITGMLSARAAALVLLFLFVSAVYYFGVIDAIGHSVIIIVLSILILSRNPVAPLFQLNGPVKTAAAHTGLYFAALILFIGLYDLGHDLSYGLYLSADHCAS